MVGLFTHWTVFTCTPTAHSDDSIRDTLQTVGIVVLKLANNTSESGLTWTASAAATGLSQTSGRNPGWHAWEIPLLSFSGHALGRPPRHRALIRGKTPFQACS